MDVASYGSFTIIHAGVPGRLRLAVCGLKDNEALGRTLERALQTRKPEIRTARASSCTGNLTITYQASLGTDRVLSLLDAAINAPPSDAAQPAWWHDDVNLVMREFGTPQRGLSADDVDDRRQRYGTNLSAEITAPSGLAILARQFSTLPTWLLGVSAMLSLISGGLVDAVLIGGVVAANAAIGFFTERRAERTLHALITTHIPSVLVRRDHRLIEIPGEQVVCGDLMLLLGGNIIAADARIVSCVELLVDESMLTGESVPVEKSSTPISPDVALADRINMLYAGTVVVAGSALALVVATGDRTEAGSIATLVTDTAKSQTPLQRQMDRLGKHLTVASLLSSAMVFGLGFLRGTPLSQSLRIATALAIAAIPEGLPAVTTSILASGLRDMERNKVGIRQLAAVETLGAINVMCFDKTGTLTQNKMTVVELRAVREVFTIRDGQFYLNGAAIAPDHVDLQNMLRVSTLCNDSEVQSGQSQVLNGSSTENALLAAALAAGIDIADMRRNYPLLKRIPRGENRRYMVTEHQSRDGSMFIALKGDPEDVLALCDHLTPPMRASISAENAALTAHGLRVIGFAHSFGQSINWLGMAGMADPVRPRISSVLDEFHKAGIRTVMVTGDQAGTALAIAQDVNLSTDLEKDVFARVSPADKLGIVRGLQKDGFVVAMIGDGTNDAPALRGSDIGVAMGRHGTNAARAIADVVLAEDDLETMIVAVRQGRTIYANLRKAVHFLVGTNSSEVLVTVGAAAFGLGQPLNPGQLLWLNLVTDVAIAYSLGLEPAEDDVMQRPPRPRDENIIRPEDYSRLALKGGLFSVSALSAHLYGMARYGAAGGGIAFSTLIGAQLLDGLSSRSETHAPWSSPENRALTLAILGTAALQGLVSVMPFTRRLLGLATLDLLDLGVIVAGSLCPFLIVETLIKANNAGSSVQAGRDAASGIGQGPSSAHSAQPDQGHHADTPGRPGSP